MIKQAQITYAGVLQKLVPQNARWLDLGCGHKLLAHGVPDRAAVGQELLNRCRYLVGVDYLVASHDLIELRVKGNVEHLPFKNHSFNFATANMVLEHVNDPGALLREIYRILEPEGTFLFHTPNYHYYMTLIASVIPQFIKTKIVSFLESRRKENDIFPTKYRINTIGAIRKGSLEAGLELIHFESFMTTPALRKLGLEKLESMIAARLTPNYKSNFIGLLRKPQDHAI